MTQPYPDRPQQPGQWPPQQPPAWPQQDYPAGQQPPPPGGPPPRRGHRVRNILGGTGAAIVVIVAVSIAAHGSGNHTVTSTGSSTSPAASATGTGRATSAASHTATAGIGSAIVLSGNTPGEQMAVTVTKVWRHATPATEFDAPQSGNRLYAVQFRLYDTGTAAYSDAPSNGAVVVDAAGQSYQSSVAGGVAECHSFPGTENIAAGASGLGCIVFEVPAKATIVKVQFTLDSGMGPQTGQWDVSLKS